MRLPYNTIDFPDAERLPRDMDFQHDPIIYRGFRICMHSGDLQVEPDYGAGEKLWNLYGKFGHTAPIQNYDTILLGKGTPNLWTQKKYGSYVDAVHPDTWADFVDKAKKWIDWFHSELM